MRKLAFGMIQSLDVRPVNYALIYSVTRGPLIRTVSFA